MTNETIAQKKIIRKLIPYLLIAPALIFVFIFTIYPMGALVYLSFTNWDLISPVQDFIGFQNYAELFSRPDFQQTIANTAIFTVFSVIIILLLAILLSLFIRKSHVINTGVQFAMFFPHIVTMVAISMIFTWLMDPDIGIFNLVLNFFGLPGLKWLQSSDTSMMSVIVVNIWRSVGYITLIVLSGLQRIPVELYEAAALDNAGKWKVFWKITFPLITPQLFYLLVTMTLSSFKVFDTVAIMTGGGPANSTNVISYYIYQYAFSYMKIGYASAAGTILLGILMLITAVYFKGLAKKVYY